MRLHLCAAFGLVVSLSAYCEMQSAGKGSEAPEVRMGALESNDKAPVAGEDAQPWYRRCLVGMEVGPTGAQFGCDPSDTAYAARFSGREIVEKTVAAHCEYVVVWAKDSEFAYYDSKVAPKCPGLGKRDVLRETVEAARPRGLPVIAYCVIQGNGYPLREHPEYKMVGADGKPIDRICLNSGFIEHAKQLVTEMLSYGIDGFHIDMLDQGFGPPYGCWCANCRAKFEAAYHRPMPKGVTWDEDWDRMLEFRYNTSASFEKELRAYIRSVDPRATVDFNYHGSPPFSWEVGQRPVQHAVNGDFVTGETGVWGFSALGVSLNALFLSAATPGQPYQIAMQRGTRMYHDQTCRPVNDLRWELFTLLAHGAQVTIVDKTGNDGSLDPVTYDRIGQCFAEARAKREHFGQPPVREVGIYYSSRSRDWYGRENPARYQQAFNGAHKILTYEHIPTGILLDENVTAEKLNAFPIVYLPNAVILSEREVALFTNYVTNGGNLLITGLTGLYDRMGRPLADSVMTELVGAHLGEILKTQDNYVRLSTASEALEGIGRDIPLDWFFLVEGPAAAYTSTTATVCGQVLKPHRTVLQSKGVEGTDWPNSPEGPVGPAVLVNQVGQGKVVCVPCSPDFAMAGEHRVVEARLLLRNIIRYLDPSPEIEVEAPLNVESVVTRDDEAHVYRVHLLGYLAPPSSTPSKDRPYVLPSLVEEAPLYRASVTVRRPFHDARALNPKTQLRVEGNIVHATVEDIHEVLVIRY